MKSFCSIGTQTEDSSCSCDLFEGMIPYRKPKVQDVQMFQTPKDVIQKNTVDFLKDVVSFDFESCDV